MKCILCLETKVGSEEHIFPEAIGGKLTTDRVCAECNNTLGSRVDSVLTDFPSIKLRRAEIGIMSKKGRLPNGFEFLAGRSTVIGDDGSQIAVQSSIDNLSKKMKHRVIPTIEKTTNSDGQTVLKIVADASEAGRVIEIIQAERRRAGLAPLSEVEAQQIQASLVVTSQEGVVHAERNIKIGFLAHALAKIAYELAFHWFGDVLLEDPLYDELRRHIISEDPYALDGFLYLGDANTDPLKLMWEPHDEHHLAFATETSGKMFVTLRIFDKLGAVVPFALSAEIPHRDRNQNSFIVLDARTGIFVEKPFQDEIRRLANMMAMRGSTSPLPDPLA